MLKYVDTKITFQEVPDEISLCINLSGCPHRCEDCHSSYLQEDIGENLTEEKLNELIDSNLGISCICFMGGDNDIPYLSTLSKHIKDNYSLKTAWYTGLSFVPQIDRMICKFFDYIKTGPYIKTFGPINNPKTNQRFFSKDPLTNQWHNITNKFWTNGDL